MDRKAVVDGKLKRRWDAAATPHQRLLATGVLPQDERARLATLHELTNPRQLRRAIYDRLAGLWEGPREPSVPLLVSAAD